MQIYHRFWIFGQVLLSLVAVACNQQTTAVNDGQIQVLATTSIVADVVSRVGREYVQVEVLLPLGVDPHSFTPTPHDIARLADAELIFANGLGLEEFLIPAIQSAGAAVRVVEVSAQIDILAASETEHDGEAGVDPVGDPHTWMDPNNIKLWTDVIAASLTEIDPTHSEKYQENAREYQNELSELDIWIREQVGQIPPDQREMVTDHLVFGYFADEYGFTQVGAIISSFSTLSETSAQDLAQLEDTISRLGVKAIFIGWSTNSNLADRIAEDTGIQVVRLYTNSLTEAGGEADNYQDFMRYNVIAITEALR